MDENEWMTSDNPENMLDRLRWANITPCDRKLRLVVCATARLLDRHTCPKISAVLEACEQIADSMPSKFGKGEKGLFAARKSIEAVWGWVWCATCERVDVGLKEILMQMRGNAGNFYRQGEVANLLREIIGNPFRPTSLCGNPDHGSVPVRTHCPACNRFRTPTVLSLAQAAYEERSGRKCNQCGGRGWYRDGPDYNRTRERCEACNRTGRVMDETLDNARLAVLSDALEEAGCPPETIEESDVPTGWCMECKAVYAFECRHGKQSNLPRKLKLVIPNPLLAHLRSPGPHYRGCWALDVLLGKA